MQTPILIAEDDPNIARLVARYLEREGFRCEIAADGETAVSRFHSLNPALIVLDLMLPGLDGWEVCRRVRAESNVPIVMLTAREEEFDRVMGLTIGADDYVVKPFSPRELVARVQAVLRRSRASADGPGRVIQAGGLSLYPEQHRLLRDGREIPLTRSEFRLLAALMHAPGRVLSREQLLDHLHSDGSVVIDRVVDVHVGRLRQKIEDDPAHPRYIVTVRGTGYRFQPAGETP
jgi:DNA-binding response OmpR family regulator